MEKIMKSIIKSSFLTSTILVILGLLLFLESDNTIVAISYLLGGTIIILGVVAFIKYLKSDKSIVNSFEIIYGIITIVFGAFIISNPNLVATVIPLVIGVWVLIKSSFKITYAIELKNSNSSIWQPTLITSILSALVGVFMIFNPFKTSVIVFKIIGIAILVYAIADIISTFQLRKTVSGLKNDNETTEEEIRARITTEDVIEADIEEIPKKENNKGTKKKNKKKKDKESE